MPPEITLPPFSLWTCMHFEEECIFLFLIFKHGPKTPVGVESQRCALEKSLKMLVKLPEKMKEKPFTNKLVKDNT